MTNLTGGKGPTELARRRSRRSIRCEVRFSEVFAGISFVTLVKEGKMAGGGLATSIVVFAAGAVLRFALTVNTYQHGFNIHTIGVILMIVAAVGAVLSLIAMMSMGMGRHRTVIDDGRGNLVRRDDTYI
jgi:hypothetical protein